MRLVPVMSSDDNFNMQSYSDWANIKLELGYQSGNFPEIISLPKYVNIGKFVSIIDKFILFTTEEYITDNSENNNITFSKIRFEFLNRTIGRFEHLDISKWNSRNAVYDKHSKILWLGLSRSFNFADCLQIKNAIEDVSDITVRFIELIADTELRDCLSNVIINSFDISFVCVDSTKISKYSLYVLSEWYSLIKVSEEDSLMGVCNSIVIGDTIIPSKISKDFSKKLSDKIINVSISDIYNLSRCGSGDIAIFIEYA